MHIKETAHTSVFPTMSARPNPQILYAGSAVDQQTMPDGVVFARLRERGIKGGDQRLAYFGWSAPFDHPDQVTEEAARDPHHWAAANPAFGIRVTKTTSRRSSARSAPAASRSSGSASATGPTPARPARR
jgi:phage terminase large subunit-like protein